MDRLWDPSLTHWIRFRNSHNLGPVVVQSFMILCAFLVVLGLAYVVLLVIAIAIHHVIYDRDPRKVPDYVKQSVQFSSDENETDGDDLGGSGSEDHLDHEHESVEDIQRQQQRGNLYSTTAKKLANLDKFMNFE